jgi:aspartate carbamoyltransferase catalytic subunit
VSPADQPRSRNLLGLQGMTTAAITSYLDDTRKMKERARKAKGPLEDLAGRTCCLMFFEPSTRTMQSFATSARALSAEVTMFTAGATSSTVKGETLLDTATNLEAIGADVFVVRHRSSGAQHLMAKRLAAMARSGEAETPGIINGGDGCHEHPTQALLDMFTLYEHFGKLKGLNVVLLGDIKHSRVARSNAWGLTACGANLTFVAPTAWIPEGVEALRSNASGAGDLSVSHDIVDAIRDADAVMALRIQKERLAGEPGPPGAAFAAEYGLTAKRMAHAKESCVVLHPGPINRGVEIDSALADSPRSLILRQVANGVFVRMAALARCARPRRGAGGKP